LVIFTSYGNAIIMDDKDKGIGFRKEGCTNMSASLDLSDTSSSLSCSDASASGYDSKPDTSGQVVCTKVIQGKKYKKAENRLSNGNDGDLKPGSQGQEKKMDVDAEANIEVKHKENRKKQKE
jgi:hypothetical protein